MAAQPTAILLDCLGTLVRLEPPAPRLAAALDVPLADAEAAMRAEIAFYRANMSGARDAASLAALRDRCAGVVRDALGLDASSADVLPALLGALVFTPFDEVPGVLRALRGRGVRLAVVSNWDVSLHDVLDRTGLLALVDFAVSSAEAGAAKPDAAPFMAALGALGVAAGDAWHVGDNVAEDVAGARAAGVRPLLIDRGGGGDLRSLDELLGWLEA